MRKHIEAPKAAEIISERFDIPLGDLVDTFASIPRADVIEVKQGERIEEYEIALFHLIREQMFIKNGFKLIMSDEEIDARTLEAMEKLRAKAESPRLRRQYIRAKKEIK